MNDTNEKVIRAQLGPYIVDVEKDCSYLWCACGRSQKQPYCDGSHVGTAFKPLRFTAEKSGKMFLCGCKGTNIKPLCDNTHSKLSGYKDGEP